MRKLLVNILEPELRFRPPANPAGVVRQRHLPAYFENYERWRRRNAWWRRIPRNAVRELKRAWARHRERRAEVAR